MLKEVIIVYQSLYQMHSEKIAKAMAKTLNCRCVSLLEAQEMKFDQYKVIGCGSGIYFGEHHPDILAFLMKTLKPIQEVFIFSSHGSPFRGKYHVPAKRIVAEHGATLIGEFSLPAYDNTGPFYIFGGGNVGRPNEKDLQKAAKFIRRILPNYYPRDYYRLVVEKKAMIRNMPNIYTVNVNSKKTILIGDRVTINQDRCIGCGACIQACPMKVIQKIDDIIQPKAEDDCIICQLCSTSCPEAAITHHNSWNQAIKVAIRQKDKKGLNG